MDYSKILMRYYIDKEWTCSDTYDTLLWYDDTIPKPTEAELNVKYKDLLLDEMREHRDRLLKDCDCKVLVDYPNKNKKAWLAYRRKLRDLPETWSESNPAFPSPPE